MTNDLTMTEQIYQRYRSTLNEFVHRLTIFLHFRFSSNLIRKRFFLVDTTTISVWRLISGWMNERQWQRYSLNIGLYERRWMSFISFSTRSINSKRRVHCYLKHLTMIDIRWKEYISTHCSFSFALLTIINDWSLSQKLLSWSSVPIFIRMIAKALILAVESSN